MDIKKIEGVMNIGGMTVMYWNTGRGYTPRGQRIVATPFSMGDAHNRDVLFLDLDRHIDGVLVDCPLDSDSIMKGYDCNAYHPVGNQDEYCLLRDLFAKKEKLVKLFEVQNVTE